MTDRKLSNRLSGIASCAGGAKLVDLAGEHGKLSAAKIEAVLAGGPHAASDDLIWPQASLRLDRLSRSGRN